MEASSKQPKHSSHNGFSMSIITRKTPNKQPNPPAFSCTHSNMSNISQTSSSKVSFVPPYSGTRTLSPTLTVTGIVLPSYRAAED